MDLQTLIDDHRSCISNKKRTIDAMHFELHRERDLARLHEDFEARELIPLVYSFLEPKLRWREVNACLMQGKDIQHHFDRIVRPLVEAELTDRTFNNRVGYGPDVAINRLLEDIYEVSDGYTRDCWIFFADISAYFPSADLRRSFDHYRSLIERNIPEGQEREDLLYILLRTTWSYTAKHTHKRTPLWMWYEHIPMQKSVALSRDYDHGAALGNQHWQVAQNYDLNDFDHWQVDECRAHYGRFVDDMWWVFQDKERGLAHIAESARRLAEYGYRMHPHKRYCQHYKKGGEFISTPFKPGRVYVNNSVVNRCRMRIRFWNRHVSVKNIGHFTSCLNSYFGKMKRVNAYGIIRNLVEEISPRWWRLCFFCEPRRCVLPNIEYRSNNLLMKKYHFKYHSKHEQGLAYYRGGFVPLRQSWAA